MAIVIFEPSPEIRFASAASLMKLFELITYEAISK